MNIIQKLSSIVLIASLCGGGATVHATGHSYNIVATTSGNWNVKGVRGKTTLYQIGYSLVFPAEQTSYFEFNLTPLKGKTVTKAGVLIPGSTDFHISDYWPNPQDGNPSHFQFKVGIPPQGNVSLSDVLTASTSKTVYVDGGGDANRNQDLGYGWVADGLHKGFVFDAFHYNTARLQNEVNAGGNWIFWASDRFDFNKTGGKDSQNYIWGSTSYNTGIVLEITTSN